jgi:hypothetical protein
METDPSKQLTDFFEQNGFASREASEKAQAELDKRRKERELEFKSAGKVHSFHLLSLHICLSKCPSFNILLIHMMIHNA